MLAVNKIVRVVIEIGLDDLEEGRVERAVSIRCQTHFGVFFVFGEQGGI